MSDLSLITSILYILVLLFVALGERKLLAFVMRRIGPILMGRNGAFQILVDLLKLMTKEDFLIPRPTTTSAPIFIALLFSCQLVFSQNFVWGPAMFLFAGVEAMILYHLILTLFGNIFSSIVGFWSQSRYAIIGTARGLVHVISLDIFITVVYGMLVLNSQSTNFHDFAIAQNDSWYAVSNPILASSFLIIFMLESKRTPFDHAETESEVVAGYATEYSGSMLLIIYLSEYFHLIIASIHYVLFFLGGWIAFSWLSLLPSTFSPTHDTHHWVNVLDFNFARI